jgi:hypothetical protein
MRTLSRALFALLSGVLLFPLLSAPTAHAYVKIAYATPVTMSESPGGEGEVRARLQLGTVPAGTSHNLRSEVVVGNGRNDGAPSRIAVGHKITCQAVGGTTLPNTASQHGQVWSGQNLLEGAPDVKLTVRMLFRPAVTGNYECLLRVYLNNGLADGYETASLRSGFVADIDGPIGPAGVAQTFGSAGSQYFAVGGAGKQLLAVPAYAPLPGATSFLATSDVYATSCYGGGGNACPDGSYPATGTATVRYRIVATPSSTAAGCVAQASPSALVDVDRYVHHRRISHQLTVTQPAGGCGTWQVNAYVQSGGGNLPFVIHGNPYSVTYLRPPV